MTNECYCTDVALYHFHTHKPQPVFGMLIEIHSILEAIHVNASATETCYELPLFNKKIRHIYNLYSTRRIKRLISDGWVDLHKKVHLQ